MMPPNKDKIAVEYFIPKLRQVSSTRNGYVHARYSITYNDDFRIDKFMMDTKRKTQTVQKSLYDIVADVTEARALICELHAYVYRHEMPRPLPDKSPESSA